MQQSNERSKMYQELKAGQLEVRPESKVGQLELKVGQLDFQVEIKQILGKLISSTAMVREGGV